jgi:hypothetical protein
VSGRRGTKNKRTESRCAALDAPSETALLLILVTQPGRRIALDRAQVLKESHLLRRMVPLAGNRLI